MPIHPFHEEVQRFFPEFDYNNPVGDRNVICNMRNPQNKVGHQQRAFSVWWALKQCSPLDLGVEIGSCRGLTPYCIHVDLHGTGKPHPIYGGGAYYSDIVLDGTAVSPVLPENTFPLVLSNHSLEHMDGTRFGAGDVGIIHIVQTWLRLLRPGGILAMIVPDNAFFDVLACDTSHFNAWCSGDKDFLGRTGRNFRRGVLQPILSGGGLSLVAYNTLSNNFSFDVVLKKDG